VRRTASSQLMMPPAYQKHQWQQCSASVVTVESKLSRWEE
jgi:hypothetical protein